MILTSFDRSLDDVFTLAHEMGHSVHTYLSCHAQSPTYCDYPIFVAEVASTCNEALLSHYLLEHTTDPATHAYVLNNFVESFRATLYRQCMFAEFERDVNEMNADGRGVTADALCERWGELNAQYFGDAVTVDDGIRLEWARIPHFYYGYYVYQYATSYAAAIAISNRILGEGAPAVRDHRLPQGRLEQASHRAFARCRRGHGNEQARRGCACVLLAACRSVMRRALGRERHASRHPRRRPALSGAVLRSNQPKLASRRSRHSEKLPVYCPLNNQDFSRLQ